MILVIGLIFIIIALWQLFITGRAFNKLKAEGGKETSPFIMLGLSNSMIFAIVFFVVGIGCIFFGGSF